MNEKAAIALFVCETIAVAQSMPISKARPFLKGFLLLGAERQELEALRAVYSDLCSIDDQFKSLQMQLSLEAKS